MGVCKAWRKLGTRQCFRRVGGWGGVAFSLEFGRNSVFSPYLLRKAMLDAMILQLNAENMIWGMSTLEYNALYAEL